MVFERRPLEQIRSRGIANVVRQRIEEIRSKGVVPSLRTRVEEVVEGFKRRSGGGILTREVSSTTPAQIGGVEKTSASNVPKRKVRGL